jgi:hypothetical protein
VNNRCSCHHQQLRPIAPWWPLSNRDSAKYAHCPARTWPLAALVAYPASGRPEIKQPIASAHPQRRQGCRVMTNWLSHSTPRQHALLGMAATPATVVRQASALSMIKASHLGFMSRARHFSRALCTRRLRPLVSCELACSPRREGNSQFSQPTIRPTMPVALLR